MKAFDRIIVDIKRIGLLRPAAPAMAAKGGVFFGLSDLARLAGRREAPGALFALITVGLFLCPEKIKRIGESIMRKSEAFPGTFVFQMKAQTKKYSLKKYTPRLAEDITERMKELRKADQESVWLIGYDWLDREIYHECIALGAHAKALVDLHIIFKRLFTMDIHKFVLVHNRPRGECSPSLEDIKLTKDIVRVCRLVNMIFLEHLIIGEGDFFSFRSEGGFRC